MTDKTSFDLDDLDEDLLNSNNDFDIASISSSITNLKQNGTINDDLFFNSDEMPTLESILNEKDDYEDDEVLKNLTMSLTTLERNSSNQTNQTFLNNEKDSSQNWSRANSISSNTMLGQPKSDNTQLSPSSASVSAAATTNSSHHQLYSSLIEKNGIVCKQATLKQISSQLVNAIERSDAGLPTAMAVAQLIVVGTSRGLILIFDSLQILKLYITTDYKDAISALSLNNKCDRLLAGNAVGYIFMFDTTNGKCLRQITDAHPLGNAILNIKFTDDSKLACFSDTGGSVFMLEFKRVMGVRGADSVCIFSGSRGEVCHIEPLKFEKLSETIVDKLVPNSNLRNSSVQKNLENINALFSKYSLLAMASFTKIFVVTLRPKLTVVFTFPISGTAKYLPILSWQLVIVQQMANLSDNFQPRRFVRPVLACARESTIHLFQVDYFSNSPNDNSRSHNDKDSSAATNHHHQTKRKNSDEHIQYQFKFIQIQKCEFKFKIYNFCWLNAKTWAIMDETEKLHIIDIRSNQELQVLTNLSECVQLVYNSSFFKSLATGGYVSKALAYAGESACYQTIQSYLGQLFMLGTRSIVLFSLQSWSARIDDFVNDNNLELALDLALSMYKGDTKALIGLPTKSNLRKEKITDKIIDVLCLYVNRAMKQDCPTNGKLDLLEKHYRKCSTKLVNVCILVDRQDILFDNIYSLLSCDSLFEGYFFESLEDHILNNKIKSIPPLILKNFIDYYSKNVDLLDKLEKCITHFNIADIDLHNLIQLCRNYRLLDAFIFLYNKALNDFITPFEEIIVMMEPVMFLTFETAKMRIKKEQISDIVSSDIPSTSSSYASSVVQMPRRSSFRVTNYGNKLLVYLCCCLCGQSYPYGTLADDQLSDRVRQTTFDYLISKRNKLIDKLLLEEKETRGSKSPLNKYLNELLDENSIAGSYPLIRIFLNFDTLDFLNVISMTFNEASFEAVIGLEKKQQLIDILIEIGLNSTGTNSYLSSSNFSISNQLVGHLFTFLARQIANKNNNIKVDNLIFSQIIEYLCSRDETDRIEEREQTLLGLLNSFPTQIAERFGVDRMLNLALKAKFYRVCEILYELRSEYYEIVDCYLNSESSQERQEQIFDVVRGILNILYDPSGQSTANAQESTSPNELTNSNKTRSFTVRQSRTGSVIESRDQQLKKLQEKLISYNSLKQLISMNPCETIHLLWIEMNIDLKYLIKTISNFNRNHSRDKSPMMSRLKSTFSLDEDIDQIGSKKSYDDTKSIESTFSLDGNSTLGGDLYLNEPSTTTTSSNSSSSELLYKFMKGLFDLAELIKTNKRYINYMSQFSAEYCELYVDLICCYEPDKILYFLKTTLSDYQYRIEECLRICRQRQVWDGAAYLLEKSGQLEAAFSLYLEKLSSQIRELQKKLETFTEHELNVSKSNIDAMLVMIIQLCQRNSPSLNDSVKEKIWFSLFDEVMKPIRGLFIQPSVELMLNFKQDNMSKSNSRSDLIKVDQQKSNENSIKERLDETREFLKRLGSHIINSMVGYLNLTTIIDRIVCDPLYGASNFGDIKDLMCKMLEMCSYEQILLSKTASLVSRDVYSKLVIFKKYSSKSFSSFTNYCEYCSRPLDIASSIDNQSIANSNSASNLNPTSTLAATTSTSNSIDNSTKYSTNIVDSSSSSLDDNSKVFIFHCGHSFHQTCLEIMRSQTSTVCPMCHSSSTTNPTASINSSSSFNKSRKTNSKQNLNNNNSTAAAASGTGASGSSSQHINSRLSPTNELDSSSNSNQTSQAGSGLSDSQIAALKAIRTRNLTSFRVNTHSNQSSIGYDSISGQTYSFHHDTNRNKFIPAHTMLEKQSKLQLAPANLAKFI